ncbi:phosphotransferase [uncultured Tateyamaria sp.]|uniref:phosphotransferase n=1 Tax=uncultured Tateyamaria sp. TaxID=455651 RepID=UPI0026173224|nr:phosphotransferase [uncultured Tateyamaria sp.]
MVLGFTDPRVKQVLGEWAQIAPELGYDPGAFRSKLIWQKDEAVRSHVVIRLKGPRRLILKRVFKAPAGEELVDAIAAQKAAHQRLKDFPKAHAPEVLFASERGDIVVMAEASGKTLNDHLTGGRDPSQMLRRTGAWLAAFHSAGPVEERTYQPRFMVGHITRMAEAVRANDLAVADPDRFVACCDKVAELAQTASGQETVSATKHGDFNLRNILLGPDGETGLDFKPPSSAPVGFDIARVLMDYAELFQPTPQVSGTVLSDRALDAFFGGYDLVSRDDPAVRFLPFVQLLNDWRLIPPDPSQRSWRQKTRYEAIIRLAQNGFGVE